MKKSEYTSGRPMVIDMILIDRKGFEMKRRMEFRPHIFIPDFPTPKVNSFRDPYYIFREV